MLSLVLVLQSLVLFWVLLLQHSGLVVSSIDSQPEGLEFNTRLGKGLSVRSLHAFSVLAWVFSGCSDLLIVLSVSLTKTLTKNWSWSPVAAQWLSTAPNTWEG